jgi:methyl-accepting chemotaxis protein
VESQQLIVIGVGLCLLLIPLAFFTFRRLLHALKALRGTLGRLSNGETDLSVPHTEKQDEFGVIARPAVLAIWGMPFAR